MRKRKKRIEEEREAIFKGETIFKVEGNESPPNKSLGICNRGSRVDKECWFQENATML